MSANITFILSSQGDHYIAVLVNAKQYVSLSLVFNNLNIFSVWAIPCSLCAKDNVDFTRTSIK
jgi:hypothetical protein